MLTSSVKTSPHYYSGFSLLELLVALGVAALIGTLTLPVINTSLDKFRVRAAAHAIVDSLKDTRQQALLSHSEALFSLDINTPSVTVQGKEQQTLPLPDDTSLTMLTGTDEIIDSGNAQIRFFHDGSSTGGSISMLYRQQQYHINIDWLTGKVQLSQMPQ